MTALLSAFTEQTQWKFGEAYKKLSPRGVRQVKEKEASTSGIPSEKQRRETVLNGVKLSSVQILSACVRLVTESGRPFSLFDDPPFQDLTRPLIEALPANER